MRSRWRRIAMFRDEALQPHVACSTEEVRPDLALFERIDEQAGFGVDDELLHAVLARRLDDPRSDFDAPAFPKT
jgi:hypothetical protein